ncbi:hypothetical protein IR145_07140 [Streptococcus danieliae]|uniref:Uncharacterized protein n=2 Tax=Streptococcus acidominimus TaxID=1326 RepID=A0A1Q8EF69_STRAI|nr:hypothetical protein [Streptococcus acidominimus]MBF0847241.1 hypothetical protein [Streptococcus danieliae]MBF0838828.1 hypothetical protein [Streptococcus acidominimus]MBF0839540.1 hypothetical protein [Streptococcus acidominimus]OLF50436.1 hypothetical protein BU200_02190 [Streptococcus acidominimus]
MKGVSMKKQLFFDHLKKLLAFHLGEQCGTIKCITFVEKGNHCFITIEDHIIETLVILSNWLSKEGVVFFCGLIYEEKELVGVQVCIENEELEKLNTRVF